MVSVRNLDMVIHQHPILNLDMVSVRKGARWLTITGDSYVSSVAPLTRNAAFIAHPGLTPSVWMLLEVGLPLSLLGKASCAL